MTSRAVTFGVWGLVAGIVVFAAMTTVAFPDKLRGPGHLARGVMANRVGRWVVLLGWMWLGWHLFVR